VPADLALSGYAAVDPGNAVSVSATVAPQWVRDTRIPFSVQRWRWVPAKYLGLSTIPNVPGCTPPEEDTNPAVCSPTPATSGTLEIDAIVNGVPQTVRKNIGVVPNPRLCEAPALGGFWYITTYYNINDDSHRVVPHTGRDYAGDSVRGKPVHSVAPGTIVWKQLTGKAGNTVIVRSGVTVNSYYLHLDSFAPGLHTGQSVAAGDVLGFVGSTGHVECGKDNPGCDPAHLHFQQHMPGGPPYWGPDGKPPRDTQKEPCFF
jgi:murein DD-endopeptidase MepM/ murein hydrolase activator NlpD